MLSELLKSTYFWWDRSSFSQVNRIMQACKESRETGYMLKMSYYGRLRWNDDPRPVSPRYYINLDVDTIWLEDTQSFPRGVGIHDGVSHLPVQENPYIRQIWPQEPKLHCLTLNIELWTEPIVDLTGTEMYNPDHTLLFTNPPRELFIVVAKPPIYCPSKIVFVPPIQNPVYYRGEFENLRVDLYATSERLFFDHRFTWENAARRLENVLTQVKEKRGRDRKREIEENGRSLKDIDGKEEFLDLSDWAIPKIRYVEAVEANNDWIKPNRTSNEDSYVTVDE